MRLPEPKVVATPFNICVYKRDVVLAALGLFGTISSAIIYVLERHGKMPNMQEAAEAAVHFIQ